MIDDVFGWMFQNGITFFWLLLLDVMVVGLLLLFCSTKNNTNEKYNKKKTEREFRFGQLTPHIAVVV